MGKFHSLEITSKPLLKDILHLNRTTGKVNAAAKIFRYTDKDTRQIVLYIPSLEITGYGSTEEKAIQMVQSSLSDLFAFLFKLTPKQMEAELVKLGWTRTPYKNKEFSKSYVDSNGDLKDFNAVADKVETLTVEV